jgi:hypothetical protein
VVGSGPPIGEKKVDSSLVVDLFRAPHGARETLDDNEQAQDIGRSSLDTGLPGNADPLTGRVP